MNTKNVKAFEAELASEIQESGAEAEWTDLKTKWKAEAHKAKLLYKTSGAEKFVDQVKKYVADIKALQNKAKKLRNLNDHEAAKVVATESDDFVKSWPELAELASEAGEDNAALMKVCVLAFYLGFVEELIGTRLDPAQLMQTLPTDIAAVIEGLKNSIGPLATFAHTHYKSFDAEAEGAGVACLGFAEALYAVYLNVEVLLGHTKDLMKELEGPCYAVNLVSTTMAATMADTTGELVYAIAKEVFAVARSKSHQDRDITAVNTLVAAWENTPSGYRAWGVVGRSVGTLLSQCIAL